MPRRATTITLRQSLSEIDRFERHGELFVFSIGFVRTTGTRRGQLVFKHEVSKKQKLDSLFFFNPIVSQQPKKVVRVVRKPSKNKGFHKRDLTIPLYDQKEDRPFKIKIYSLIYFNGMRVIRPVYDLNRNPFYPVFKSGKVEFNTKHLPGS